jgi:hypothetical protein
MEHLNYCRQMVKQFTNAIAIPSFPDENRRLLSHAIDLAQASQKFLLPEGGRLYDDQEYRALDEREPLNLPYPFIALEYTRRSYAANEEGFKSTKSILFARQRDEAIVLMPVMWVDHMGIWGPAPEAAIPRVGYLDRAAVIDGYTAIKMHRADDRIPLSDYADEAGALLCFLNVLQCKNVHVKRSEPKKTGRKIKAALPFDAYHVLTIDFPGKTGAGSATGGHRSPREHLRRGHIRCFADGRRIWVNATVVAAGRGAGVVAKVYAVGCASETYNVEVTG